MSKCHIKNKTTYNLQNNFNLFYRNDEKMIKLRYKDRY